MAAYVLAELDVHDPEGFQHYREKVPATIEQYGGRYIVHGGEITPLKGGLSAPRLAIVDGI